MSRSILMDSAVVRGMIVARPRDEIHRSLVRGSIVVVKMMPHEFHIVVSSRKSGPHGLSLSVSFVEITRPGTGILNRHPQHVLAPWIESSVDSTNCIGERFCVGTAARVIGKGLMTNSWLLRYVFRIETRPCISSISIIGDGISDLVHLETRLSPVIVASLASCHLSSPR